MMSEAGILAEDQALVFLRDRGLNLTARNYRCRLGEIDLIMMDGKTLVFIEVRMRRNRTFGGAAESITQRKRMRIIAAARHYLAGKRTLPACRFDAVLIEADAQPVWIKDAFGE
jgi:putative endonuclease